MGCDSSCGGVCVLKKGCILSLIGIVLVIALAGCLSKTRNTVISPVPTAASTPAVTVPTDPSSSLYIPTGSPKEEIPLPKDDIIIYSLNPDNFEKIAISVKVESETITLFDLAKKIAGSLEDESFSVKVKDAYFEKTTAVVDFSEEGAPGVSSPNYEANLLDCIAQSIIENYESCTAVVFRIDGGAYKSTNFSYGIDEAYLIK